MQLSKSGLIGAAAVATAVFVSGCGQQGAEPRAQAVQPDTPSGVPPVVGYAIDGAAIQWVLFQMPDGRVQRCQYSYSSEQGACQILPAPRIQ